MSHKFAIIDIETTGGHATRDKITEIAVAVHDGNQVVDSYETLINPGIPIPYFITKLTGITDSMVADAPYFYEVAKKIVEITEGTVFVAHNVRFDYNFIQKEFKELGFTFSKRKLCTVKLSRKTFPGFPSYGLDHLIKKFDLPIPDGKRHRAMGDVIATTRLFEMILEQQSEEQISDFVNLGVRASKLPPGITFDILDQLPESCGVYFLHNADGDIAYVGKSINIKKRIWEHFSDTTRKGQKIQKEVRDISFELTGSELASLLLESHYIKTLQPIINRAQRTKNYPYIIYQYENDQGYQCLDFKKVSKKERSNYHIVNDYGTKSDAQGRLWKLSTQDGLCRRLCGLEPVSEGCIHYQIEQCEGACIGKLPVEDYNKRVETALKVLETRFPKDFFLIDRGRRKAEQTVFLIQDNIFKGWGYLEAEFADGSIHTLFDTIKFYDSNPEVLRIIHTYLKKNKNIIKIDI